MSPAQLRDFMRGCFAVNGVDRGAESPALLLGGGTNAAPVSTSLASKNFLDFRTKSTEAGGGDSRGIYWRHYLSGTLANGEAGRFFTTVDGAANGCHGIHSSVSFGTSGTCTGQVAAVRGTLHVPDKTLGGTNGVVYAEMYADGKSSNVSGVNSFLRCVLGGDATGAAALEDAAALLSVSGGTNASGNVVGALTGNEPTWTGKTGLIRVNLNGTVAYIPVITL